MSDSIVRSRDYDHSCCTFSRLGSALWGKSHDSRRAIVWVGSVA